MKTKTVQDIKTREVYVADDGKEFFHEDACLWYEAPLPIKNRINGHSRIFDYESERYYAVYYIESLGEYGYLKSYYNKHSQRAFCDVKNIYLTKFPQYIFVLEDESVDYLSYRPETLDDIRKKIMTDKEKIQEFEEEIKFIVE